MLKYSLTLIILLTFCGSNTCYSAMKYYRSKSDDVGNLRQTWYTKVLELALSKTEDEYGPYELRWAPTMTPTRSWDSLRQNRYANFIFFRVFEDKFTEYEELTYIDFPFQRGLLGYRVCFRAKGRREYIRQKVNANAIKQLTFGQGREWADVKILKHNGFKVTTAPDYFSLFKMTAANRFDLFCRGINEVYDEFYQFRDKMNIDVEEDFLLYYPMPVFCFMNKENALAIERLHKGIIIAYEDGSLVNMFRAFYGERLAFLNLAQRKIITLENPFITNLESDYDRYQYQPGDFLTHSASN